MESYMFSKPSFNRNEPITRKDLKNVLGASSTPQTTTAPGQTVSEKSDATLPGASPEARPEVAIGDNQLGARLIVGPDVTLKGAEILDCDTLVVEGHVDATMDSRVIRIAEKGSFAGKVSIDIAEIHGTFEGELTARSQLIIHATGRVHGTIRYGKLVIDEGGELCGDVNALTSHKPQSTGSRDNPAAALISAPPSSGSGTGSI